MVGRGACLDVFWGASMMVREKKKACEFSWFLQRAEERKNTRTLSREAVGDAHLLFPACSSLFSLLMLLPAAAQKKKEEGREKKGERARKRVREREKNLPLLFSFFFAPSPILTRLFFYFVSRLSF